MLTTFGNAAQVSSFAFRVRVERISPEPSVGLETRKFGTRKPVLTIRRVMGLYLISGSLNNEVRKDFRTNYESIKRLSSLLEHIVRSRDQEHFIAGACGTIQLKFRSDSEGPRLFWRVWHSRRGILYRRPARTYHENSGIRSATSCRHCRRGK